MTKAIQKTTLKEFAQHLTAYSDKLAQWCPQGGSLTPAALVRFGTLVYSQEPKLQHPSCWPSLRLALITAAQLGLEPSGAFGEAHILPYKQGDGYVAQLQPGYRGLVKLMRQSGEIRNVRSQVVHERDAFEIIQGDRPSIHHKVYTEGDRGEILGAYSIAYFADGEVDYEWAPWSEIVKAKKPTPAWKEWPGEMARKFVIKRHSKQLPMSPIAVRAIAIDNVEGEGPARVAQIIDIDDVVDLPEQIVEPEPDDKLAKKLKARQSKRKENSPEETEGVVCSMCSSPFFGEGEFCEPCAKENADWEKDS